MADYSGFFAIFHEFYPNRHFFIVLGKSHISFTQIDEILPDLGKTR